jgi:hypothetical protein
MDISSDIFRQVNLEHPVDSREINTTRRNISRKQNSLLLLNELVVNSSAFVLLLLTVEFK